MSRRPPPAASGETGASAGKPYWEDRYRSHAADGGRPPNAQLVAEAAELAPGTALDAGCGEGADAMWLASRGWRVTAVDFATTALDRARERAEALGAETARRIDWAEADLTWWAPPEEHFDLVSSQYAHPEGPREDLFRRFAAAVAPGGTLLVVGHHPSDPHSAAHAPVPDLAFTAEQVADSLDPERWDIVVAETRHRQAASHGHHESTFVDTVLRARRRP